MNEKNTGELKTIKTLVIVLIITTAATAAFSAVAMLKTAELAKTQATTLEKMASSFEYNDLALEEYKAYLGSGEEGETGDDSEIYFYEYYDEEDNGLELQDDGTYLVYDEEGNASPYVGPVYDAEGNLVEETIGEPAADADADAADADSADADAADEGSSDEETTGGAASE
jgi:hypothetical protein